MIKFQILSLKSDLARRQSIKEQLAIKGGNVEYTFFDAITPSNLSEKIKFNKSKLTDGEKCCALGHVLMCQDLLQSEDEYRVFMEDDAKLDFNDFNGLDDALQYFHDSFDVVILGYSKVDDKLKNKIQFFRPLFCVASFKMFFVGIPYKQWKCGTVCYSISVKGAKKIIQLNSNCSNTADDWYQFEKMGLKIVHLMPIVVTEKYNSFASNIESGRNTFKQRSLALRYFAGVIRHVYCLYSYLKYKLYQFKSKIMTTAQ